MLYVLADICGGGRVGFYSLLLLASVRHFELLLCKKSAMQTQFDLIKHGYGQLFSFLFLDHSKGKFPI